MLEYVKAFTRDKLNLVLLSLNEAKVKIVILLFFDYN